MRRFLWKLKNELFYGRSWAGVSIEEFMGRLDSCLHWYNEKRIKMSLGVKNPLEYRQALGKRPHPRIAKEQADDLKSQLLDTIDLTLELPHTNKSKDVRSKVDWAADRRRWMEYPRWTVKITSKGQVTLPKAARDLLLVRDGDRLDVWIKDDALVLRKSEELDDPQLLIRYARSRLTNQASGEVSRVDASVVRESIGRLPVDLTALVRESRERP